MHSLKHWAKTILFLVVFIFSSISLVLITDTVVSGSEDLAPFNAAVDKIIIPLRSDVLTDFMVFVTNALSPVVLSVAVLFIAIGLILYGDTYDTLLYLVSIAVAIISFVLLKETFQLSRPEEGLLDFGGWSFPSGHATVSTAFFFSTAYTFFDKMKTYGGKILLVLVCVVAAGLVSFSRVYLGAHFGLDVLAGIALGLMAVCGTAIVFNIFLYERERLMRRKV